MNQNSASIQFLRTTQVYDCLGRVSTTRLWVEFLELKRLDVCFRNLKSALGDGVDDDYWAMFNWRVRRFQFLLSCVPLAPNHPAFDGLRTQIALVNRLSGCNESYPAHTERVKELVKAFEAVLRTEQNHLLRAVIDHEVANSSETVLVVREGQFIDLVQQELLLNAATNKMQVMSPKQISKAACCSTIVTFGPRRWYPEYLFMAPKGEHVYLTCYSWISDQWRSRHQFLQSQRTYAYRPTAAEKNDFVKESTAHNEVDEDNEIVTEIDVSHIIGRFGNLREESTDGEQVDATLLLLEDDKGVFIDASEDSKTMTINLDLPQTGVRDRTRFRRIRNADIQAGDYVILRTKGGGDYLRPVADRFLGQHAERARTLQQQWKDRLSALVQAEGALPTSIALLDVGSMKADENNLRTWMSQKNIGPQDFCDFEAIMKLIGMEGCALEYWSNAELIRSAHMKAGMYIRRLLLKVVAAADLSTLESTGRMEFELNTTEASLTAFRVRCVSTERFKVASSKIAEPFEVLKILEPA
jgi:hypothetical protein